METLKNVMIAQPAKRYVLYMTGILSTPHFSDYLPTVFHTVQLLPVSQPAGCGIILDSQHARFIPAVTMGSYYDVDTILTDAQKVPCTFELSVPGLGYLDGNSGADVRGPPHLYTYHIPSLTQDNPRR